MLMIPTIIPAKFELNSGVAAAAASDYVIVVVVAAATDVVVAVIVAADTVVVVVVVVAATPVPLLDLTAIKKVLSEREIQLRHGL